MLESFSVNELLRISKPGAVVPSLFWLLPIGNWDSNDVYDVWRLFTEGHGPCNEFGLFLAKGDSRWREESNDLNLAGVAAALEQVLPKGTEQYYNPRRAHSEGPQLFFLSGAYPQPGWGVLVNLGDRNPANFTQEIVQVLVRQIPEKDSNDMLGVVGQAKTAHRNWMSIKRSIERGEERFDPVKLEPAARETLRSVIARCLTFQWEWGPRFLASIEQSCRKLHVQCRSVAWDPPRMVGWKIFVSGISITVEDLHHRARTILGSRSEVKPSEVQPLVATGSYLTDYVHYVATSKPGSSTRNITADFIASLLRPTEIRTLSERAGASFSSTANIAENIDALLTALGWEKNDAAEGRPLASCLCMENHVPQISEGLSFSDLRITIESFCKDFIDVAVRTLGLSEQDAWTLLLKKCPNYRKSRKTWSEEMANLTIGSAKRMIRAIGPEAFGENEQWKRMGQVLTELHQNLNPMCHHQESTPMVPEKSVAPSIAELLSIANGILKEMPWHFKTCQRTGIQPSVATGTAWSHSHPEERLLSVMLWSGELLANHALIWNPSLTNPVITDPVFISRP